ncbi:MAG: hypothetical protein HC841_04510, partial [Verrucomicrobiae bacterium]|nr:hypothetical protein [Verrucomicrobiae bacterium]
MTNPHIDTTGRPSQQHPETRLSGRGVVRIAGPDSISFLDKLATNDLEEIAPGEARFSALLSPQGKVLFEFLAVRPSDSSDLMLDIAREMAEPLVKRLSLYKLRAKVEIADVSRELAVAPAVVLAVPGAAGMFNDPRNTALPSRTFVPARSEIDAATVASDALSTYDAARIKARVPEMGRDYATGDLVAHEALLDRLHGVSFTKGCYVGQEIVARMEHRGTARKRFVRVTAGRLPETDGCFHDKVFKAGSAVLNSLLKILNERSFDAGDGVGLRDRLSTECLAGNTCVIHVKGPAGTGDVFVYEGELYHAQGPAGSGDKAVWAMLEWDDTHSTAVHPLRHIPPRTIDEPWQTFLGAPVTEPDPTDAMRAINDRISAWIEAEPGQWFWLHRRWKYAGRRTR